MLRLIPKLSLHFHVVSHDRASRKMFSVMLNKTKKTSFPWRHPCICSLMDHLWTWQRPITELVAFTSLYTYGWSLSAYILKIHIFDSIKIALGIGNWVLGSYCLVVTQANHYIVSYDQMLNAQLPIPNAQGNLYWISYMYFQYIRTQWPECFKQSDWFAISDVIFTALQGGDR